MTLKGGAELRVLPRPITKNLIAEELREWTAEILNCPQPPDAIACVAFVWSQTEARYLSSSVWDSQHPALPVSMLPDLARAQLAGNMAVHYAEHRVMHLLGYRPIDPPEGAA